MTIHTDKIQEYNVRFSEHNTGNHYIIVLNYALYASGLPSIIYAFEFLGYYAFRINFTGYLVLNHNQKLHMYSTI